MNQSIHDRLKHLIEGTYEVFNECGAVNTDYAGFAALSLSDFKNALDKPELTGHELRKIIRKGHTTHHAENPQVCWATFMAQYVRSNANNEGQNPLHYDLKKIYEETS